MKDVYGYVWVYVLAYVYNIDMCVPICVYNKCVIHIHIYILKHTHTKMSL